MSGLLEMPSAVCFRLHRPLLEDSMKTLVTVRSLKELRKMVGPGRIEVREYWLQPDERIGWDRTYIVMRDDFPVGFTDGPL